MHLIKADWVRQMRNEYGSSFPPGALVRVAQICGEPKKGVRGILPISASTWWLWVKTGRVPVGRKLSPKCTAWPIEVVLAVGGAGQSEGQQ